MSQERSIGESAWLYQEEPIRSMPLPTKFRSVMSRHKDNPITYCILEPDIPHEIVHTKRFGQSVMVYLDCSKRYVYCLPHHYARVVSDYDIELVNSHKWIFRLILCSRSDRPDVFDLAIISCVDIWTCRCL
jgi:hypothetical protein